MKIIRTVMEMQEFSRRLRLEGKSIGLVPTMGYLHEGHLSLIKVATQEADVVVVSVFVNPIQFGLGEDYEEYPRDLSRDTELAGKTGAKVIFAPAVKEMYPDGYASFVEVERLTESLCGASRPGHFRGVTTVVTKLLNIVQPDKAFFGQKDAQQAIVIKRMVEDLNMQPKIIMCPIIREQDGLAMSSRNVYLNPEERKAALVLSRSLVLAKDLISKGERRVQTICEAVRAEITREPLADIDYIDLRDGKTLVEISRIKGQILLALAVRIGKTRLIDNLMMEVADGVQNRAQI